MGTFDYEVCSSGEVICPYCKHKDGFTSDALGDDETCEEQCSGCGKTFIVRASVSVDHQCYKKEDLEE